MRLASVGRNVDRNGSRKPPLWTMRRILPVNGIFLSTSLRRASFCLLTLCFSHPVSVMLLFRTFKTHCRIQFTRSLSQFDTMALRSFGRDFLVREVCGNLSLWFSLPISLYIKGGASFGKMQVGNLRISNVSCDRSNNSYPWGATVASRYACNSPLLSWGSTCRARCENWFLSLTFFQNNNILWVQWDIATVLALMKQVLGNRNDTDIRKMAAFR